ncbi:MAG: hypothetical protein ACXWJW_11500 [Xanthobacteraceae bacterium]
MRIEIQLALLFLGAWLVFFALVPVQNEAALPGQMTEFSSRARSGSSMDDHPRKSGLQIAIEGRLRWLGVVK